MQRQIPPLAEKMLDSLESFISLDTPFRIEERQNRIDLVRSSLAKPKVTASEQVRQVLEAYNIEAEYGRKIDTYESTLNDGTVVNILVIGRIGMFYQTKDETETGVWNNDSQSWEIIDGYRRPVRDGIRMAKKKNLKRRKVLQAVKQRRKKRLGGVFARASIFWLTNWRRVWARQS